MQEPKHSKYLELHQMNQTSAVVTRWCTHAGLNPNPIQSNQFGAAPEEPGAGGADQAVPVVVPHHVLLADGHLHTPCSSECRKAQALHRPAC